MKRTVTLLSVAFLALGFASVAHAEDDAPKKVKKAKLKLSGFVDTYGQYNFNNPKPQNNFSGVDFPRDNGFALGWAGIDASYTKKKYGFVTSLRYGPYAEAFTGEHLPLKQAFVYVDVAPKVRVNFGRFDTVYGLEVVESHLNVNYTRGAVNWNLQPYYHQGLKVDIEASDALGFSLLAVNGWNNSVDNNFAKGFGATAGFSQGNLSLNLGYLGSAKENDVTPGVASNDPAVPDTPARAVPGANDRLTHLVDVIVGFETDKASVALNADYVLTPSAGADPDNDDMRTDIGAALVGRFAISKSMGIGLRGEYITSTIETQDGSGGSSEVNNNLMTGTLTLDHSPGKNVVIKADFRYDMADSDAKNADGSENEDAAKIFPKGIDEMAKDQAMVTVGVVVFTD